MKYPLMEGPLTPSSQPPPNQASSALGTQPTEGLRQGGAHIAWPRYSLTHERPHIPVFIQQTLLPATGARPLKLPYRQLQTPRGMGIHKGAQNKTGGTPGDKTEK